jgi:hypothetical protein
MNTITLNSGPVCWHDHATKTIGPTTHQINWYCPDCGYTRTTYPTPGDSVDAPVQQAALTDAARAVLAERQRQISAEGWTPEHDDEHDSGSMAIAAACYAIADRKDVQVQTLNIRMLWRWTGWADLWFKPKDRRHNLVRAGALIIAEVERIDRAALKGEQPAQPSGSERGNAA